MPRPEENAPLTSYSAYPTGRNGGFCTTMWSTVVDAGGPHDARAAAALERLCQKYWYPIFAFIRRRGADRHEAEDLTQAFFAHLLEKQTLKKADQQKGKFRSFLLASLTHFLVNEWDKRQALKRGGHCQIISLEAAADEELFEQEPGAELTPEGHFERRWALALVDQVMVRLRQEYISAGKGNLLSRLEPALTGEVTPGFCAGCAPELGMNESAVRMALHRLRRRFGQLLRSEVAHTVSSPSDVQEEIRHLFTVISR